MRSVTPPAAKLICGNCGEPVSDPLRLTRRDRYLCYDCADQPHVLISFHQRGPGGCVAAPRGDGDYGSHGRTQRTEQLRLL